MPASLATDVTNSADRERRADRDANGSVADPGHQMEAL
jgi:hypothetical protein